MRMLTYFNESGDDLPWGYERTIDALQYIANPGNREDHVSLTLSFEEDEEKEEEEKEEEEDDEYPAEMLETTQNAILNACERGIIRYIDFKNSCVDTSHNGSSWDWDSPPPQLNKTKAFDFFLRLVKSAAPTRMAQGTVRPSHISLPEWSKSGYAYSQDDPITREEASQIANAIRHAASNNNNNTPIDRFDVRDKFTVKGSFEEIFNAALESGVRTFYAHFTSNDALTNGCIANSNFSSNATLKKFILRFHDYKETYEGQKKLQNKIAEQLAEVIRTNHGLEEVEFDVSEMFSEARKILFQALPCNSTLLRLDLPRPMISPFQEPFQIQELQRKEAEQIELVQREIDALLKMPERNRYLQQFRQLHSCQTTLAAILSRQQPGSSKCNIISLREEDDNDCQC